MLSRSHIPTLSRREFLSALMISGGAAAAAPVFLSGCTQSSGIPLLSVARQASDEYSIRIFSSDHVQQSVLPIPARAHALTLHPSGRLAVCHDRRPGRRMYVVDLDGQELSKILEASHDRHFFGHGAFSSEGDWLYVSENDYESGVGVIGAYRTRDWQRVFELPAHGIGCHELRLHPDGETLIVANGGILTHPDRPREKLNLETMAPRLSYIDRSSGELLESVSFGHHQLSIRHLDISPDGTVVFGMQFQGEKTDIQPLVAMHRRGESVQGMNAMDEQWLGLSQYIASVVCLPDNKTVATTSPRGNRVVFWDVNTRSQIADFSLKDAAGAAVTGASQIAVSNGLGEVVTYHRSGERVKEVRRIRYPNTGWDNHMMSVI